MHFFKILKYLDETKEIILERQDKVLLVIHPRIKR